MSDPLQMARDLDHDPKSRDDPDYPGTLLIECHNCTMGGRTHTLPPIGPIFWQRCDRSKIRQEENYIRKLASQRTVAGLRNAMRDVVYADSISELNLLDGYIWRSEGAQAILRENAMPFIEAFLEEARTIQSQFKWHLTDEEFLRLGLEQKLLFIHFRLTDRSTMTDEQWLAIFQAIERSSAKQPEREYMP
ncbi:MAG TPA: hypothetical protein VMR41_06505 [Patescibacteria group bacterium]|nr:hypothetical protein [Patescibacteria group bacterium]